MALWVHAISTTISGIAVDTEASRLMVANDPTGVFGQPVEVKVLSHRAKLCLSRSASTPVGVPMVRHESSFQWMSGSRR